MEQEYIRIGTTYYKNVQRPLVSGKFAVSLQPWSAECIKQDHGKSFLSSIPKYDGLCFVPGHLDYKREIGRFYNSYHPFPHEPQPGYPRITLVFLNHVFGDQLDLGLDYLKILLLYPTQMLPILCLVSTERNTGKTTFLNFLKAIFGDNMTINSNEDFRSNFNAEWAHNHELAIRLYDREIKEVDPANFLAWNNRGLSKVELGKTKNDEELIMSGIEDFQTAISLANAYDEEGFKGAENNIKWAEKELESIK